MSLFSGENPQLGPNATVYDVASGLGFIPPSRVILDLPIQAAAGAVPQNVFVADRPYQVMAIKEVHSTVSTSGTLAVRKITDTSAPNAAAGATVVELLSGTTTDLSAGIAVNVVTSAPLVTTAASVKLAAGNRIALNFGGTVTGYVGYVQIELQPLAQ